MSSRVTRIRNHIRSAYLHTEFELRLHAAIHSDPAAPTIQPDAGTSAP